MERETDIFKMEEWKLMRAHIDSAKFQMSKFLDNYFTDVSIGGGYLHRANQHLRAAREAEKRGRYRDCVDQYWEDWRNCDGMRKEFMKRRYKGVDSTLLTAA